MVRWLPIGLTLNACYQSNDDDFLVDGKLQNTTKPVTQMLLELKTNGVTPIEAIKAIRIAHGLSLGESKRLFALSPAWKIETASGDVLHGEVISSADSDTQA